MRQFIIDTKNFIFCRVLDERLLEFLPDQTIRNGSNSERHWGVINDVLSIQGDTGTFELKFNSQLGMFTGQGFFDNENVSLIITPLAVNTGIVPLRQETEIRVFAQARSGHHAIIGWMAHLFPQPSFYLNDSGPFSDPYLTHADSMPFTEQHSCFIKHGLEARISRLPYWESTDSKIQFWRDQFKHQLICNYEDFNFTCYADHILHPVHVGKSSKKINVIVIRDPFNYFASLLMHTETVPAEKLVRMKSLWKQTAREIVGETCFIPDKICILYNRWFSDRQYRNDIALQFGLTNTDETDKGIQKVSCTGDGSSFRLIEGGPGPRMKVLNRWEHYVKNKSFWQNFDEEMYPYWTHMFGQVIPRVLWREKVTNAWLR